MELSKIFDQNQSLENAKLVLELIKNQENVIEDLMLKINDPHQLQAYLEKKETSKDDLLTAISEMQLDMMKAYLAIVNEHTNLFKTPGEGAVTQAKIREIEKKVRSLLSEEFGL